LFKARSSTSAWWLAIFPGLMIFITVSAYNLIGDALRDATDPRLKM
jgi:peptide/nickel transport system permease protein